MQKLVSGAQRFRHEVLKEHRQVFERLSEGQKPQALFITCSDSRIDPNLLTQSEPGEVFILRNAGNIIPPWGASNRAGSGEIATIEFALEGLGIEHIIVCGHSHCGAIKGLVSPEKLHNMPALREWMEHAAATRRIVETCYADRTLEERENVATQENVLQQIVHLETHPSVAARLAAGRVHLHGWIYKITTGEVFAFDGSEGQFRPLNEVSIRPPPPRLLEDALL